MAESSLRAARHAARHHRSSFGVSVVGIGVLVGVLSAFDRPPPNPTALDRLKAALVPVLVAALVVVALGFFYEWIRAPYRQRDVLRASLRGRNTEIEEIRRHHQDELAEIERRHRDQMERALDATSCREDLEAVEHRRNIVDLATSLGELIYSPYRWSGLWDVWNTDPYAHLLAHLPDDPWVGKLRAAEAVLKHRAAKERKLTEIIGRELAAIGLVGEPAELIYLRICGDRETSQDLPAELAALVDRHRQRRWREQMRRLDDVARRRWDDAVGSLPLADDLRTQLRETECNGCRRPARSMGNAAK